MLEIRNLHKRYGDVVALDGWTIRVQPGRMLGFLGRNGAGKTTTMRAVFGLLQPDAGAVCWDGHGVGAADRMRFGYMPEERGLYPRMAVRDQLAYFGRLHGMAARAASDAAERWLDELDLGDRMGDRLADLSQGNQQRVQLAAALIHEPELLVLDEPFNGLDPIGAGTMARVLRDRAAAGTAVMFSSHQLDVVEDLCEDIAIIEQGRIVLTGEVQALKAASPHRVVELDVGVAPAGDLEGLEGVIDVRRTGDRHRMRVDRDVDVHRLLLALGVTDGVGGVAHLVYTTPSLAELFTEAVAAARTRDGAPA